MERAQENRGCLSRALEGYDKPSPPLAARELSVGMQPPVHSHTFQNSPEAVVPPRKRVHPVPSLAVPVSEQEGVQRNRGGGGFQRRGQMCMGVGGLTSFKH
jgi:hypothetical protein